jgi:hypothetical protein
LGKDEKSDRQPHREQDIPEKIPESFGFAYARARRTVHRAHRQDVFFSKPCLLLGSHLVAIFIHTAWIRTRVPEDPLRRSPCSWLRPRAVPGALVPLCGCQFAPALFIPLP